MLIKIKSRSQLDTVSHLPMEVVEEVKRVVTILDENYNDLNVDGGYVLIAEFADDLETIIGRHFDYREIPFEFANRIKCSSSDDYVSVLYLLGTEYSATVITPISIIPTHINIVQGYLSN